MEYLLTNTPIFYLTQSLWRDEAFSVLLASHSIFEIVILTAFDFTPPLYYILLHFWMVLFGTSEIAIRMMSFLFFTGTIYFIYVFAKEINGSRNKSFPAGTAILASINPMLLYFAFEARTYMLTTMLAVSASHFFVKRKWTPYIAVSVLGLYSHPYIVFLLLVHFISAALQKEKKLFSLYIKSAAIIALLYVPWLVAIYFQIERGGSMWFYDVDRNLIEAVLGNFYLGYEGTPNSFWIQSKRISLLLLVAIVTVMYSSVVSKKYVKLVLMWFLLPLILVLTASFIRTIYVMRYLTFIVPAEVMILSIALYSQRNKWLRRTLIIMVFGSTALFNIWYTKYNKKIDFRRTFKEVNHNFQQGDTILTSTALPFFESVYYALDQEVVYLYNPKKEQLPAYVGAILIPETRWKYKLPEEHDSFMIYEDGSYVRFSHENSF